MKKQEMRNDSDLRIMNSAIKKFAEYGYNKATFAEIAKDTGVTAGLIAQRFNNKENLFEATVLESYGALEKYYETLGVSKWDEYFNALVNLYKNSRENEHLNQHLKFVSAIINEKNLPDCYEKLDSKYFYDTKIAKAIKQGQEDGEVKEGDIRILYILMHKTICNIILLCDKYNIEPPKNEYFLYVIKK